MGIRVPKWAVGIATAGLAVGSLVAIKTLWSRNQAAAERGAAGDDFAFDVAEAKAKLADQAKAEAEEQMAANVRRREEFCEKRRAERAVYKANLENERREALAYAKEFLQNRGLLEETEEGAIKAVEARKKASALRAQKRAAAAGDAAVDEEEEWVDDDSELDVDSDDSYVTDAGLELQIANEYDRELREWIDELKPEVSMIPSPETLAAVKQRQAADAEAKKAKKAAKKSGKKAPQPKLAKLDQQEEEMMDWCRQYVETDAARLDMVERARAEHDEEKAGHPFDPNTFHSDDDDGDFEEGEMRNRRRGGPVAHADEFSSLFPRSGNDAGAKKHTGRYGDWSENDEDDDDALLGEGTEQSKEEMKLLRMMLRAAAADERKRKSGAAAGGQEQLDFRGEDGDDEEDEWDDEEDSWDDDEDDAAVEAAMDRLFGGMHGPVDGEEEEEEWETDDEDQDWEDDPEYDAAMQDPALHERLAQLRQGLAQAASANGRASGANASKKTDSEWRDM